MTPPKTLGARIRARNPRRIANNPWTNSRDLGSRSGTSTISGSATDSASRLEQAKTTGDNSGAISYEEAREALGW